MNNFKKNTPKKLLIASNNAGKVKEIRQILDGLFDEVLSPGDLGIHLDPDETGVTFAENAALKCAAFAAAASGYYVLADDSGLCVDTLCGAPGVHTARYAGEHATSSQCMDKLLDALDGVSDRSAHFETAVCLRAPDGAEYNAHGKVDGHILTHRDGEGGFGYDPVFFCDEIGCSFASADDALKNSVSHRARALAALKLLLKNLSEFR